MIHDDLVAAGKAKARRGVGRPKKYETAAEAKAAKLATARQWRKAHPGYSSQWRNEPMPTPAERLALRLAQREARRVARTMTLAEREAAQGNFYRADMAAREAILAEREAVRKAKLAERKAVREHTPRNLSIRIMRRSGATFAAIGEAIGITKQRAKQICDMLGANEKLTTSQSPGADPVAAALA
jgi:hypothetical protein